MIHCRSKDSDKGQGEVLDIRETQRVEYTFMHTQRDDWMIADEKNCGVLGGQSTFGFGDAIRYLKRGLKVARKGWNGKGMFLTLVQGSNTLASALKLGYGEYVGEPTLADTVFMKTADNKLVAWLCNQSDMLADDWIILAK